MRSFRLYSDMPYLPCHKSWAEIDSRALEYNYRLLRAMTPNVKHICTVKADAYGHISALCVGVLLDAGCRFFAVSCIEEAVDVRNACIDKGADADILILGYTDCSQAAELAGNNIIQTVISREYAEKLNRAALAEGCVVRTHVALDTGMNRIGLPAQREEECARAVADITDIMSLEGIVLEGMFTHFARSDEDFDSVNAADSHTRRQFARFQSVRGALLERGIKLFSHVCNSAAAVRFPEFRLDGVRLGILLYGVRPSEHIDVCTRPVMSFHTVISHIHELNEGETVSYGGHYSASEKRKIATIPIGYADGFLRAFSGAVVTVSTAEGNFKAPVVGNICMDQCMIDVTEVPCAVGDIVTVFGNDPEDLSRLARLANTIEYEVLCLISARIPRIVKENRG